MRVEVVKAYDLIRRIVFFSVVNAIKVMPARLLISILLSLISIAAKVYFPILLRVLIDRIAQNLDGSEKLVVSGSWYPESYDSSGLAVFLALVWFLSSMLQNIVPFIRVSLVAAATKNLTENIFDHVNQICFEAFKEKSDKGKGEFFNAITNIPMVIERIFTSSFQVLEALFELILITYSLALISGSRLLFVGIIFANIAARGFLTIIQNAIKARWYSRIDEFHTNTISVLNNHELILVSKSQPDERAVNNKLFDNVLKESTFFQKTVFGLNALESFINSVGLLVLNFILLTKKNFQFSLEAGLVTQLNFSYLQFSALFSQLGGLLTLYANYYEDIRKIGAVLDLETADRYVKTDSGVRSEPVGVKLEGVSFWGNGGSPRAPILRGLNINLPPTQRLVVVGPSGVGKTSMARMIAGLYKPNKGSIIFYRDARSLELNPRISFVSAEPLLFENRSVYDNLCHSSSTRRSLSFSEIMRVIRICCLEHKVLDEKAAKDPGLVTRFSTGEKKRLSLARALLADADVIIFDEPTSGLDQQTRDVVMRSVMEFCANKTIIIISHDPAMKHYGHQVFDMQPQDSDVVSCSC